MALHARLLGAAAIVSCYDDPTRAWELLRVAQEMAASTADDRATLDVAIAELNVFWSLAPPDRTWSQRALKISDDIEELAAEDTRMRPRWRTQRIGVSKSRCAWAT